MDDVTCLKLKWNHFKENFTSQFGFLKDEEEFVDVTFSCQGKLLRAHKIILSASSPYLTSLFKDNPCKHPTVILDIPFEHLQSLIAFIYTGSVNVAEAELPAFLESAGLLQIRGLSENSTDPSSATPVTEQYQPAEVTQRKRSVPPLEAAEFPPTQLKRLKPEPIRRISKLVEEVTNVDTRAAEPEMPFSQVKQEDLEELTYLEGSYEEKANSVPQPPHPQVPTSHQVIPAHNQPDVRSDWEGEKSSDIADGRRRHSLDPRPCPICNRQYSNLSNLRQHLRLIHNPTLVTCKLCTKTFKTDLYLRRHLISFHGDLSAELTPPWRSQQPAPTVFKDISTNQVNSV